jgi:hypothetical protein
MIVTLAEMKAYLGITDSSQDAFLTEQLTFINEAVESYCARKFDLATYTQKFHYDDYRKSIKSLELYHYPLVSVTEIKEDDVVQDLADYRVHNPTGKITANTGFFSSCQSIVEVTYQAGYSTIPATIKNVVYSVVEERYNRKQAGISLNFGADVQRIALSGVMSIDFDYSLMSNERKSAFGTILGNWLNVLDAYRSERIIIGSGVVTYVS